MEINNKLAKQIRPPIRTRRKNFGINCRQIPVSSSTSLKMSSLIHDISGENFASSPTRTKRSFNRSTNDQSTHLRAVNLQCQQRWKVPLVVPPPSPRSMSRAGAGTTFPELDYFWLIRHSHNPRLRTLIFFLFAEGPPFPGTGTYVFVLLLSTNSWKIRLQDSSGFPWGIHL